MNHAARLDRLAETIAARDARFVIVHGDDPAGLIEDVPAGLRMCTGDAFDGDPLEGLSPEQKARIGRHDRVIAVRRVPMTLDGKPLEAALD